MLVQQYSSSLHATETGISSGLMGPKARIQTLPFLLFIHMGEERHYESGVLPKNTAQSPQPGLEVRQPDLQYSIVPGRKVY